LKLLIIRRKRETYLDSKLEDPTKGFCSTLGAGKLGLRFLVAATDQTTRTDPKAIELWLSGSSLRLMFVLLIHSQFIEEFE